MRSAKNNRRSRITATIFRLCCCLWAISNASVTMAGSPAPADNPNGFVASYSMRYGAFKGEVYMELTSQDAAGEYLFRIESRARGLFKLIQPGTATEESRFLVENGAITPLEYHLDGGRKSTHDNSDVVFDWQELIAYSTYEDESTTLQLIPDVRDRLSTDIFLMMQLAAGITPAEFKIAEKNAIRNYEFNMLGEEKIATPAGEFQTVKYLRHRVGSSRSTRIWYAIDKNYLPVRIEQLKRGKISIVSVAESINTGEL